MFSFLKRAEGHAELTVRPREILRIRSDEGLTLETSAFESLYGGRFTLSMQLIEPNYDIKSIQFCVFPHSSTLLHFVVIPGCSETKPNVLVYLATLLQSLSFLSFLLICTSFVLGALVLSLIYFPFGQLCFVMKWKETSL